MYLLNLPIILLLVAILTPLSAIGAKFKVDLLNEHDGFASSIVFSIVQDQDYSDDVNSLAHNNAGNLALDRHNNLWIGSWGGSVSLLNQQAAKY